MGSPPQVGWFGRTFGWENTPTAWAYSIGLVGWLAGLWYILSHFNRWATGELALATAGWLLILAGVARDAVRDMFGPVFFYEVIRVARRRLTFTVRFLFALGLSSVLVLMFAAWLEEIGYYSRGSTNLVSTQKLSSFATQFFEVYAVVSYSALAVLTPVYVAGAIAVEKERKTLEFLLATDLRNREIVFGKVAARVVTLIGFALVGMPILAVLQLFGGIDPELLLGLFAVTLITVLGLAAVSIWMSALLRRARDAIMLTYMLVLVYVAGTVMLAGFAMIPQPWTITWDYLGIEFTLPSWLADAMAASGAGNPLVALIRNAGPPALRGSIPDALRDFAIFWGLVTAVCIGWAVLRVRAVTLNQSYGPVAQPRAKRTKGGKDATSKVARRYPDVGENPVLWKEVFVESGFRGGWVWRVLSVLAMVFILIPLAFIFYRCLFETSNRWSASEAWYQYTVAVNVWSRVVTGTMVTLMLFAVAIRGAGAISGEKDRDTWISLVGTPMSASAILWGKWWGCLLGMRKPLAVLLAIWAFTLASGGIHPLTIVPTVYAVFLFLALFSWVGLYCSMRASNSLTASIQAFFAAVFLAGGFWVALALCCFLPLGILGAKGREIEHIEQVALGFTPPLVCGFLPFRTFDDSDLGPFSWDQYFRGLGPYSLILGLTFWTGVTLLLGLACHLKFRGLTNRAPVYLAGERAARAEFAAKTRPTPGAS